MSLLEFFGVTERQQLAAAPVDDRYYDPMPAPRTVSGVRVDESTALNYSVCWAATRLLAGTAGWLPFNLYKRLPSGGAMIDFSHRVHRGIHDQPNRDMGSMMFRARGVNHQVNWGNTFAEIRRTIGGEFYSLEPIHPRRIPLQNIRRGDDGRIVYLVNKPDGMGQPERVTQENMFHVPSIISDEGIVGKGVVTAAREAIGKAIGTQRRGAAANNNGGSPPLALKGAKFKDKAEREEYRRQINEVHSGPENAGKWLLLPPDSEVQMLGFSLEDSQFIESEQFDIEEIARWYGMPPHLVGHLLRATFNNIEELGISFVKYSLIQWLKLWEQEVWRKLLTANEQDTHYAKFVVDALERGNMASRTEAGVKKFFNGHWTLNQWAEQEDENPVTETVEIDGKTVNLGDIRFVQQAMIPLSQAAKGIPGQQPTEPPAAEKPPQTDPEAETMRADIATVTANAATLALSVERIITAVGSLQNDNSRLAASLDSNTATIHQLAATVDGNHAAATAMMQGMEVRSQDAIAAIDSRLTASSAALAASQEQLGASVSSLAAKMDESAAASAAAQAQLAQAFVRDVLARLLSAEIHRIRHILEKPDGCIVRLQDFYQSHTATMQRQLTEPLGALLSATGDAREPSAVAQQVAGKHAADSFCLLLSALDGEPDEMPARVDQCISKWHDERTTISIGE